MINNKKTVAVFGLITVLSMLFLGAQWQLEMADIFILTWEDPEAFNWIFTQCNMNAWAARDFFMALMDVCWIVLCSMLFYYIIKSRDMVITRKRNSLTKKG